MAEVTKFYLVVYKGTNTPVRLVDGGNLMAFISSMDAHEFVINKLKRSTRKEVEVITVNIVKATNE